MPVAKRANDGGGIEDLFAADPTRD